MMDSPSKLLYDHVKSQIVTGKAKSWGKYVSTMTMLQRIFNNYGKPCRSLGIMTISKYPGLQYCNNPICPSCWYRKNLSLLSAICKMRVASYMYIRNTWFVPWDTDIHPRCVQRFKSYHSRYRLVGYTLNFDALSPYFNPDDARRDPFGGELSYQLIGVFASDKLVSDKNIDKGLPDQVAVNEDPKDSHSRQIGIIDREVFTNQIKLISVWLDRLNFPFLYHNHPKFGDYINRFFNYNPSGRSWTRIRKIRHDNQNSENFKTKKA